MSEIKYEIVKNIGVLSKFASGGKARQSAGRDKQIGTRD